MLDAVDCTAAGRPGSSPRRDVSFRVVKLPPVRGHRAPVIREHREPCVRKDTELCVREHMEPPIRGQ